jgi:hypothetical protein
MFFRSTMGPSCYNGLLRQYLTVISITSSDTDLKVRVDALKVITYRNAAPPYINTFDRQQGLLDVMSIY